MRHRKSGVKLNRNSSHRKAMFRNMVTSLFKYERIRTTDAKAKALRGWADHLVTLAKRGDLHARRQALAIIREKDVVHKLFEEAADKFGGTNGGYTRVIKLGRRPGDAAPVSLVELVTFGEPAAKKKKKTKPVKETATVETAPAVDGPVGDDAGKAAEASGESGAEHTAETETAADDASETEQDTAEAGAADSDTPPAEEETASSAAAAAEEAVDTVESESDEPPAGDSEKEK